MGDESGPYWSPVHVSNRALIRSCPISLFEVAASHGSLQTNDTGIFVLEEPQDMLILIIEYKSDRY